MKTNVSRLALLVAILFVLGINPSQAGTYSVTVLPSPQGSFFEVPFALNNSGQVVGYSLVAPGAVRAVLWDAGKVTELGTLGGNSSTANAINDAGVIVGFSENSAGVTRATRWDGTTAIDLDPSSKTEDIAKDINNVGQIIVDRSGASTFSRPALLSGNTFTELPLFPGSRIEGKANALNDSGQVAGAITDIDALRSYAVRWDGNTYIPLGVFDKSYNSANDINNAGIVVGDNRVASGSRHATRWSETGMADLGTLPPAPGYNGESESGANAINEAGQIVGYSTVDEIPGPILGKLVEHATLWDGGVITDLNLALDVASTQFDWIGRAYDINDKGVIVAEAWRGGFQHAVLLTPVPESEAFVMLLAGLGLLGFKLRHKLAEEEREGHHTI